MDKQPPIVEAMAADFHDLTEGEQQMVLSRIHPMPPEQFTREQLNEKELVQLIHLVNKEIRTGLNNRIALETLGKLVSQAATAASSDQTPTPDDEEPLIEGKGNLFLCQHCKKELPKNEWCECQTTPLLPDTQVPETICGEFTQEEYVRIRMLVGSKAASEVNKFKPIDPLDKSIWHKANAKCEGA